MYEHTAKISFDSLSVIVEDEPPLDLGAAIGVMPFGWSGLADGELVSIPDDSVVRVACGGYHSALVCATGRVFVFGANKFGQLGIGFCCESINEPTLVKGLLTHERVKDVACGADFTLFLTEKGSVFGCGSNEHFQLANDSRSLQVGKLARLEMSGIAQIAAGNHHAAALTETGRVYMFGWNSVGQLGIGHYWSSTAPQLLSPAHGLFTEVACGGEHTALVTVDGALLVCGANEDGQLGLEEKFGHTPRLETVTVPGRVGSVAAGDSHTIALTADGVVYAWGRNSDGQRGVGEKRTTNRPEIVPSLKNVSVHQLAVGQSHSAIVTDDGRLYVWGCGAQGQLCNFSEDSYWTATELVPAEGCRVKQVACGKLHTLLLVCPTQEFQSMQTRKPVKLELGGDGDAVPDTEESAARSLDMRELGVCFEEEALRDKKRALIAQKNQADNRTRDLDEWERQLRDKEANLREREKELWPVGQSTQCKDATRRDDGLLRAAEEQLARLAAAEEETASNAASKERALNERREEVENKSRGLDKRLKEIDQREQTLAKDTSALVIRERDILESMRQLKEAAQKREREIDARETEYTDKERVFVEFLDHYEANDEHEAMKALSAKKRELEELKEALEKRELEIEARETKHADKERAFVEMTERCKGSNEDGGLEDSLARDREAECEIEARAKKYTAKEQVFIDMMTYYDTNDMEEMMEVLSERARELSEREKAFVKREEAMMDLQERLQMKQLAMTAKERDVGEQEKKMNARENLLKTREQKLTTAEGALECKSHSVTQHSRELVSKQEKIDNALSELNKEKETLDTRRSNLNDVEKKLDEEKAALAVRDNVLEYQGKLFYGRDSAINEREQVLVGREQQVAACEQVLVTREQQLVACEQDMVAREQEIVTREQDVFVRERELVAREQQLDEQVSLLEGQLVEVEAKSSAIEAQEQALWTQVEAHKQVMATFDDLQGRRFVTATCPQCKSPSMCPPIRICLNGHGFCDNCWMSQLEPEAQDQEPVFCQDCQEIGEAKLLEAHRFACPKRPSMCLVGGPNCKWTGFYEDVVLHTEEQHLDRHYVGATQEFVRFNHATTAHLISTYNELFVLTCRFSAPPERNQLHAVVQHIAAAGRDKRFAYKFELLGYDGGEDSMVFRRKVLPDNRNVEEIFLTNECVSVVFQNGYTVKPNMLDCRVQIARR